MRARKYENYFFILIQLLIRDSLFFIVGKLVSGAVSVKERQIIACKSVAMNYYTL